MLFNCPGCARRKAWLKKQATALKERLTGHPKVPGKATLVSAPPSLEALNSDHVRTRKT